MDNYEISRDRAQAYFLNFDQQALIDRWDLPHDADTLTVEFFGKSYSICRKSGVITRASDGAAAGFGETLTMFDLLCHEGEGKAAAGSFAPVNSLRGAAKTAGVETDFHRAYADRFDKDPRGFSEACLSLGGKAVAMGDLGFRFSMFGDLDVLLKFYHSDEDFPAALTLLWDENTLQFMFYEPVFYAAGVLLQAILDALT